MTNAQFFASCPRGLEAVLANELAGLQAQHVKPVDGGVHFAGPWTLGYAANLHSRVASRVLWHVGRAPYRAANSTNSDQDIYDATKKIEAVASPSSSPESTPESSDTASHRPPQAPPRALNSRPLSIA